MATAPISTERLDALRQVCAAYGGDPARWPQDRRAALGDLLDTDEAAEILTDARALDGFLNAATAPHMAEDLPRRILAGYAPPAHPTGWREQWRALFTVSRLVPAGAAAGLGALGLVTGLATAPAGAALTPEAEAIAYLEAWSLTAGDGDASVWEEAQ